MTTLDQAQIDKATQRFVSIRLKAASRWPYCAEAIFSLIPVATESVPRMAIDRHWRVYFNPQWVLVTDDVYLLTTILHEFGHALRRHFKRFIKIVGVDPETLRHDQITLLHHAQSQTWNIATDCEINDDLHEEGLPIKKIPDGGAIIPADLKLPNGLTAEQYYEVLWKDAEKQLQQAEKQANESAGRKSKSNQAGDDNSPGSGDSERQGGSGSAASEATASGADGDRSGESSNRTASGKSGSSQSPSKGAGGTGTSSETSDDADGSSGGSGEATGNAGVDWKGSSAVDGFQRTWEQGREAGETPEGEEIPRGLSEAEQEHLANQVAKKIEQASRSKGNVPAGMRRWAHERLNPQIPWQRVLRGCLTRSIERKSGARDYTFGKVSRREPARPDLISSSPFDRKLKVRVVVDTSGSMRDKDLAIALAEIEGILRKSPARDGVEVVSCDAQVYGTQRVNRAAKVVLQGGGGTEMSLPIEQCREEKAATRPDVLIICTDGETSWPSKAVPGVDVIAVITRQSTYHSDPPAWIKKIQVN